MKKLLCLVSLSLLFVACGAKSPEEANDSMIAADMVRVEGGTFTMGGAGGEGDELPAHQVTVSSFYIGKYEVTQAEWTAIMGNNPSVFKGDYLPVENVSWLDAIEYCNRRSVKEGLQPVYSGNSNNINVNWSANGYRLPTEAEWEYAANGGSSTFLQTTYSDSNNADTVAWYGSNSGSTTHAVGTKAANSLGIHDMSGNVWEWCWDRYGSYSSASQTNPVGAVSGEDRVLRGGSWDFAARYLRPAYRDWVTPFLRNYNLGVRVVRR